jgi:hypothetical protein
MDQHEAAAARAAPPEDRPAADPAAAATASNAKHRIGAYEISEGELATMMTRQAADDLRKTQVPASPADYKLDFEAALPAGVDFRFDESDPGSSATLDAARQWAHAQGLSQSEFSKLLAMYI